MTDLTVAHLINPVIVGPESDLYIAQPVTFATMEAAREAAAERLNVELWAAFYPGDEAFVPPYFKKAAPLEKSVLDYGRFTRPKKLPLIKDLLDRLHGASQAEYFVYANVDIALMPDFYTGVEKIISRGYDGFVINRRTISRAHTSIQDIPLMIAESGSGERHPGFDCFVFKRAAVESSAWGRPVWEATGSAESWSATSWPSPGSSGFLTTSA